MNNKITIAILLGVIVLIGCEDTTRVEATGRGQIRGINGIVDSPELLFQIEETVIDAANFRGVAGFAEYDDLDYNFNFDVTLPGDTTSTRIATQFLDVTADFEHTLVLSGSLDSPTISIWEDAERTFAESATAFDADFMHLAPSQGIVDIYFALEGTAPVLGQAVGSLSNGERIQYVEYPDGEYEFIVTPANDPATILFQSNPLTPVTRTRVTFAIFDSDSTNTSVIAANLIGSNGVSAPLVDTVGSSRLRLIHAAFATANVDTFINDDLTTAIFSGVAFGQRTTYLESGLTTLPTTLTAVGDINDIVIEQNIALSINGSRTIILGGDPGNLVIKELNDDGRPLSTFPAIRITNMSVNVDPLDIYFLDPGTTITEETPLQFFEVPYTADTGFFAVNAGMFEFTITSSGSLTPISVPLPIDAQNGDVLDILILDTADPTMVEVLNIDSLPVTP